MSESNDGLVTLLAWEEIRRFLVKRKHFLRDRFGHDLFDKIESRDYYAASYGYDTQRYLSIWIDGYKTAKS